MKRTEYQEFVIKILLFQLNDPWISKNIQHNGIKTIFKLMTRLYPEYNQDGKKAYKNLEKSIKHHRITTRAAKILDAGGVYEDIHAEHIYPNQLVFEDILGLCKLKENITEEDIVDILCRCEVIIVSKEEQKVLDGKV